MALMGWYEWILLWGLAGQWLMILHRIGKLAVPKDGVGQFVVFMLLGPIVWFVAVVAGIIHKGLSR